MGIVTWLTGIGIVVFIQDTTWLPIAIFIAIPSLIGGIIGYYGAEVTAFFLVMLNILLILGGLLIPDAISSIISFLVPVVFLDIFTDFIHVISLTILVAGAVILIIAGIAIAGVTRLISSALKDVGRRIRIDP